MHNTPFTNANCRRQQPSKEQTQSCAPARAPSAPLPRHGIQGLESPARLHIVSSGKLHLICILKQPALRFVNQALSILHFALALRPQRTHKRDVCIVVELRQLLRVVLEWLERLVLGVDKVLDVALGAAAERPWRLRCIKDHLWHGGLRAAAVAREER